MGLHRRAGNACEKEEEKEKEEASAAVTTHQALSGTNRRPRGPLGSVVRRPRTTSPTMPRGTRGAETETGWGGGEKEAGGSNRSAGLGGGGGGASAGRGGAGR